MWSNNVTEGDRRLVFKGDLESAMDTLMPVDSRAEAKASVIALRAVFDEE